MSNSGKSFESPQKGLKITLMKGAIGAVSLVGTAAIPVLVQRALTPPTASSPAQIQPAQVTTMTSSQNPPERMAQDDDKKGKGKKKGRKHD